MYVCMHAYKHAYMNGAFAIEGFFGTIRQEEGISSDTAFLSSQNDIYKLLIAT